MDANALSAITFDCYGTLIDWEAGIRAYVAPILERSRRGVTPEAWIKRWERIQFQLLTPYRPYREILSRSYDATMKHFGIEAFVDAGPGLARSVGEWRPFADTTRGLRRLARRYRLGIVSNIDNDLLAATLGHLQAPFSCLVTAEEAGAYKPDQRPLRLALERLGLAPAQVLHAGFGWRYDLAPAQALGMRTAFIRRQEGPEPDGTPPDVTVPSVEALALHLLGDA
jgi:2-haloalkanoic acid dehalogenase type II